MRDSTNQQLLGAEDFEALATQLQLQLQSCAQAQEAEPLRLKLLELTDCIMLVRARRSHYAEQIRQLRAVRAFGQFSDRSHSYLNEIG